MNRAARHESKCRTGGNNLACRQVLRYLILQLFAEHDKLRPLDGQFSVRQGLLTSLNCLTQSCYLMSKLVLSLRTEHFLTNEQLMLRWVAISKHSPRSEKVPRL